MARTPYCGKTCETCAERLRLSCPGCKDGPGRPWACDCAIARCCREKGFDTCVSCVEAAAGCEKLADRAGELTRRIERRTTGAGVPSVSSPVYSSSSYAATGKEAEFARWLWVLLFLFIPTSAVAVLNTPTIESMLPGLHWLGTAATTACSVFYGVVLLKLSTVTIEEAAGRYKAAGVCAIISTVAALFSLILVSLGIDSLGFVLAIDVPLLIVSLVAKYQEFTAHAAAVEPLNDSLAGKWRTLWKWYVGLFLAFIGSLFFLLVSLILGVILMLVSALALLVVCILELVYIYQMARLFESRKA